MSVKDKLEITLREIQKVGLRIEYPRGILDRDRVISGSKDEGKVWLVLVIGE